MAFPGAPAAIPRDVPHAQPSRWKNRSLVGYLWMPVVLAVACLALYLYVHAHSLDDIEQRSVSPGVLGTAAWQQVLLTVISTVLVILFSVPMGVLLTRPFARRIRPYLLTVLNLGQALPTIGIFALFAVIAVWLGYEPAIVGLALYTIIPVLLNTMVGIDQVDDSVLESGRGMGISKMGVLWRIELPLAVPIMLAGVRTALVINVGTATLATYINGGGFGDIISAGLATNRQLITLTGAALTAVLALLIDYLAGVAEDVLRPRGL